MLYPIKNTTIATDINIESEASAPGFGGGLGVTALPFFRLFFDENLICILSHGSVQLPCRSTTGRFRQSNGDDPDAGSKSDSAIHQKHQKFMTVSSICANYRNCENSSGHSFCFFATQYHTCDLSAGFAKMHFSCTLVPIKTFDCSSEYCVGEKK